MNVIQKFDFFDELVLNIDSYLKRLRYSESVVKKYLTGFKKIKLFMINQGVTQYDSTTCDMFIKKIMGDSTYQKLSRTKKDIIRCAYVLLEFSLTESISFRSIKKNITYQGSMGNEILNYLSYRKSNGISKDTLDGNSLYLRRFQDYLESHDVKNFIDITHSNLLGFIKSLSFYSKATKHCTLHSIRGFLRYLYDTNIITTDWTSFIPKDNYKKEAKLPTTYTQNEIEAILKSIDRSSPKGKRDYVIILLAARLGLRASDICGMTFKNVIWEKNIIVLNQHKTGKRIELPLIFEIGNSIIDHLKYARPKSDLPYLFLQLTPPYDRMQEPTIHSIVTQYMRYAGIKNYKQKKHGPHALRHSLASLLLEKKTPLPVISEVLGHTNTDITKTYLKIDLISLRQCALEIPPLNTTFYEIGWCQNDRI